MSSKYKLASLLVVITLVSLPNNFNYAQCTTTTTTTTPHNNNIKRANLLPGNHRLTALTGGQLVGVARLDRREKNCTQQEDNKQAIPLRRIDLSPQGQEQEHEDGTAPAGQRQDLQQASSNRSTSLFREPAVSELVVEPIASPFIHSNSHSDQRHTYPLAGPLAASTSSRRQHQHHQHPHLDLGARRRQQQQQQQRGRHPVLHNLIPASKKLAASEANQFVKLENSSSSSASDDKWQPIYTTSRQQQNVSSVLGPVQPNTGAVFRQLYHDLDGPPASLSGRQILSNGLELKGFDADHSYLQLDRMLLPFTRQRRFSWLHHRDAAGHSTGRQASNPEGDLQVETINQPSVYLQPDQPAKEMLLSRYLAQQLAAVASAAAQKSPTIQLTASPQLAASGPSSDNNNNNINPAPIDLGLVANHLRQASPALLQSIGGLPTTTSLLPGHHQQVGHISQQDLLALQQQQQQLPINANAQQLINQMMVAMQQQQQQQQQQPAVPGGAGVPQDVGQDGSSMVAYSLLPATTGNNQQQQQQQPAEEQQTANGASQQAGLDGLTPEQLIQVLQQLGQQPTQQQQQQQQTPDTSTSSQQQQPGALTDASLVALLETMVKTAIETTANSQHQAVASQQQQQQQPSKQLLTNLINRPPALPAAHQQQQRAPSAPNSSQSMGGAQVTPSSGSSGGSSNLDGLPPVNGLIPPPPPPPTTLHQQHQPYPQHQFGSPDQLASSTMMQQYNDPLNYHQYPRGSSKRHKGKSRGKHHGKGAGKYGAPGEHHHGPRPGVMRVQKRPRVSSHNGQPFHDINSPSDLQPSATLHKWKYPWLYNEEDDEEEGETEINLRFFNNFSRMGPLGGVARTVAPATFIVSLAFLILSNISLAATVIVHGISSFMRSFAQQSQPAGGGPGGPGGGMVTSMKLASRLAKLLNVENNHADQHGQPSTHRPHRKTATTAAAAEATTTTRPAIQRRNKRETKLCLDDRIRALCRNWT